mgnify:CR=1 FL=1
MMIVASIDCLGVVLSFKTWELSSQSEIVYKKKWVRDQRTGSITINRRASTTWTLIDQGFSQCFPISLSKVVM